MKRHPRNRSVYRLFFSFKKFSWEWHADQFNTLLSIQVQDKDELTMKKLKTEGGDKEGIKEAEVFEIVGFPLLKHIKPTQPFNISVRQTP